MQGEEVPAISRFQAAAVGGSVFIHNHRSLSDVLVLDAADPAAPKLALQPVTGAEGTPMSRCGLLSEKAAHYVGSLRVRRRPYLCGVPSV